MAETIRISVKCPKCQWRLMDKISPTSGRITMKCPRCRNVVELDLALRRRAASCRIDGLRD